MSDLVWEVFEKVELRVGTILEVENFAAARKPAFILKIDFGPTVGVKKSSAQITGLYSHEALTGKKVLAVTNFPPKQIGPSRSECLVTGFRREDGAIVLTVPDDDVPNGARLG